jgi:hypothetical protein
MHAGWMVSATKTPTSSATLQDSLATRILYVIMLDYPVNLKVRPMPGMWVQSAPVTAIPEEDED